VYPAIAFGTRRVQRLLDSLHRRFRPGCSGTRRAGCPRARPWARAPRHSILELKCSSAAFVT
jgi:hypothetical protein